MSEISIEDAIRVFTILNNDPYQVKRTAKCIHCEGYQFVCERCGAVTFDKDRHPTLAHYVRPYMPYLPYTSKTIALCKLLYPSLGQALRGPN